MYGVREVGGCHEEVQVAGVFIHLPEEGDAVLAIGPFVVDQGGQAARQPLDGAARVPPRAP